MFTNRVKNVPKFYTLLNHILVNGMCSLFSNVTKLQITHPKIYPSFFAMETVSPSLMCFYFFLAFICVCKHLPTASTVLMLGPNPDKELEASCAAGNGWGEAQRGGIKTR